MIFEKVKKIIKLELGIGEEEIKEGTTFKDLEIESLELIEIIIALEDEFDIKVIDEDIENIKNIADLTKYVQSKVA